MESCDSWNFLTKKTIRIKKGFTVNATEPLCSETITGGVLRNFAKFTGNHMCLRSATLLKKRLWHSCFPVNFAKLLRITFLQNTSGRLLLFSAQNNKKGRRIFSVDPRTFFEVWQIDVTKVWTQFSSSRNFSWQLLDN